MSNQQKQLQSILAEVGINLTENQALAVMEALLLLQSKHSYWDFLEFKRKYSPQIQDSVNVINTGKLDLMYSNIEKREIDSSCFEVILVGEYPQKANQDKCISIEDANKIVSNACSYANYESLASHYNENNQPER